MGRVGPVVGVRWGEGGGDEVWSNLKLHTSQNYSKLTRRSLRLMAVMFITNCWPTVKGKG